MCWRAHLLWIGQGLAQETRAHPPPHQRVSHLYLSSGMEPHTLGHTLLATARGSQLWVASSRGCSGPRQVWTWAWTWHPLLPAQLCFFPPPCEPWGSVSLSSSPVGHSHTARPWGRDVNVLSDGDGAICQVLCDLSHIKTSEHNI